MTREEAISRLKEGEPFSEIHDPVWDEALDMAISALKEPTWQEKLEKEYLFESIKEDMTKLKVENERLLEKVETLKGEWIYDKGIENWRCSKCGQTPPPTGYVGKADFMATYFKFCPNCRADMQQTKSEDKTK